MLTSIGSAVRTLSRELAIACDHDGVIEWMDDRALEILGVAPGASLRDVIAPGSEEKLDRMLAARGTDPASWELLVTARSGPMMFSFRTMPYEGGLLLVGSLLSQDYSELLSQMGSTMSELSVLHRETERQQQELTRLNRELHESGRGMQALYTELEDKADSLQLAGETKTRFIANMSHELRTPLNSIIGLTQLLLERIDGDLTPEQAKQIGFIRSSANALAELVNDLLDLSKLEAGKLPLRTSTFDIDSVFSVLRGMLRPIAVNENVALVFEEATGLPYMETDEGKVSQILRNFITNALKFTEQGEVRVTAATGENDTVIFSVRDTGIGIAESDHPRLFEEFSQIDSPLQRKVKGTGLGLSVSKRLAELLGGRITVESGLGKGSTFSLVIPRAHPHVSELSALKERGQHPDPELASVLVVEDDHQTLFLYEKYLAGSGFQVIPARSIDEARELMLRMRPAAIVLDVMLDGETSWRFLQELKRDPSTSDIPVLVVTVMDREKKARALGADEFYVKPIDRDWMLRKLQSLAARGAMNKVLVIDDDQMARYLMRRLLRDTPYALLEAADGPEGVRLARLEQPDVIFLDFILATTTAFEVLDELKVDPRTRGIPVIISTAKDLADTERARLAADTSAILTKDTLSREVAITRIREALSKAVPPMSRLEHSRG